jgi:flagellar motility protein MotE (MotC chaperone)
VSADTLRLVLQIVGVVVGGGILEFIRRMLARRAELRNLNTQSDATALGAANEYVKTLQDADKALRGEITDLKAEIRRMQTEWNAERVVATDALNASTRQLERALTELARTKADLVVARAQITELGGLLPGRHRDPTSGDYDDWRKGP